MKHGPNETEKNAHLLYMCAIAAAMLAAIFLYYLPFKQPYQVKNAQPLYTGWSYHTESDPTPVDVPVLDSYIPCEIGEWLTLKRRMTEQAEHPALLVRLTQLRTRIYLDDVQLFENLNDPPGENAGMSVHLIPLPDDYAGRELRVETASPYELYAYSPDTIWFGDVSSLAALIPASSARDLLYLIVAVVSGLFLLGLGLLSGFKGDAPAQWGNFAFGIFSILYGLNHASSSNRFFQAFPPALGANLHIALWYLFPIPLLWFLRLKCTRFRRAALVVATLYSAASVGTLLSALLGVWQLPFTIVFMNPVLIAMVGAVLIGCALEIVKGNAFFRMVTPAILLLCGSAVLSAIDIGEFYELKEYLRVAGILLLLGLVWTDSLRSYFSSSQRKDEESRLLRLKTKLAREQFEAASAHNRETHLLRHEIRHHMIALLVLQREGNLSAIGDYLKDIVPDEQSLGMEQYCEHSLVNAILSRTSVDCWDSDIDFQCEAYVPQDISIQENDLSGLLLNMLENAFEAAQQAPEASRWIAVQVRKKDRFLVICCRNGRKEGVIQQDEGRFSSTKPDARFHGYGILAMQRIAEKHGSKLNIDYDETSFSVKTILRLGDA